MKNNDLTLGSLFDGSGGFPLGGLLCGITPIWSSEIEPFPIRVTTKRLPFVKHYGDIKRLNGADLEPVDIITFGSPCQDMSIAGKRDGLSGSRSNLFFEAVRIIKEMRCATNGEYPKYAVWENVTGAFSSNSGEDFRCVLEEMCKVIDANISIPRCEKWNTAGEIMGDGFSIAWRTFDAQYWGVPQRRRRIYLVADFNSECAGKILFESESLSGYSPQSFRSWERTSGCAESGSGTAIKQCKTYCLNPQGSSGVGITENKSLALVSQDHGNHPAILQAAGFCTEHSAKARSIGYKDETSPTLRAGTVPAAVCFENHSQDTRYRQLDEVAPTVSSTYGTGGNNQPFVVEKTNCFDVRFTSEGTKNIRANVYETDVARTLDTGGTSPDRNQGGVAVVAYGIDRAAFNQGKNAQFGIAVEEELEPPIVAKGPGAVAQPTFSSSKASFFTRASEEVANSLVASDYKDPPTVNDTADNKYIVRRLTPTECARLQGFPDWWCDGLETEKPTDEDLMFWRDVFETHRKVTGSSSKPKSDKQILKWLKNPHSDSAEYKMWGNGVALPNVVFVLAGIVYFSSSE